MLSELGSKLAQRIDGRIDVPAEPFLSCGKSMHDVLKCRVSDHQKIDVARRAEFASCRGSEQERNLNAIAKRGEPVTEQIDQSGGLGEETPQFREDRRLLVGLEVHLTALHCAPHQTRCRQKLHFALNGSNSSPGLADDLA
jgi:hypothetical protein